MAIQKPKTTESDVSVEINLKELLGSSAENQSVRETFFQLAYDKLLERLDKGVGADGKKLGKYSKEYMNSLVFAAYGKSSTVDMQLTGGMVASIEPLKQDSKSMKIGFGEGENEKAYGHMSGFEGHPTLAGKVKPRNFFGWSDKELVSIAKELRTETKNDSVVSDEKILKLLDRLLA